MYCRYALICSAFVFCLWLLFINLVVRVARVLSVTLFVIIWLSVRVVLLWFLTLQLISTLIKLASIQRSVRCNILLSLCMHLSDWIPFCFPISSTHKQTKTPVGGEITNCIEQTMVSLEKNWEKNEETKVCIRKRFKNLLNLLNLNFMCT